MISLFTLLKSASTSSSAFSTARAISMSRRTNESTLFVTMFTAARAISAMCRLPGSTSARICSTISAISEAWSPMRSISAIIFIAAEMRRRSFATGCCCKSKRRQIASISRSLRSISCSVSSTARRSASSRVTSTFAACEMPSSHSAPMRISSVLSSSSCSSKRFLIVVTFLSASLNRICR